jgi:hypothetical protein
LDIAIALKQNNDTVQLHTPSDSTATFRGDIAMAAPRARVLIAMGIKTCQRLFAAGRDLVRGLQGFSLELPVLF